MKPVVQKLVRMVFGQCTSDSRLMVGVNLGRPQRSSHHKMSIQNLKLQILAPLRSASVTLSAIAPTSLFLRILRTIPVGEFTADAHKKDRIWHIRLKKKCVKIYDIHWKKCVERMDIRLKKCTFAAQNRFRIC